MEGLKLSGIDEQYVDVSKCPLCDGHVLTWKTYSADRSTNIGYYNCTGTFKGPNYYNVGSVNDICSFACCVCHKHIERGKLFFNILLRNMLNTRKVR